METHRRQKGKGGRPRSAQGEARKRTIGVRVNMRELDVLRRKADEVGLPLAQWLRQVALQRHIPHPLVPELNRTAYAELAKLASNINQLTRAANEGRIMVPLAELENTQKLLRLLRLDLLGVGHDCESG